VDVSLLKLYILRPYIPESLLIKLHLLHTWRPFH